MFHLFCFSSMKCLDQDTLKVDLTPEVCFLDKWIIS